MRRALKDGDARGVAEVASASARINDSYLPKPYFVSIVPIAETRLALGVQVAHTGSVIGIHLTVMRRPDLRPARSHRETVRARFQRLPLCLAG